jgi:hypothetical protein
MFIFNIVVIFNSLTKLGVFYDFKDMKENWVSISDTDIFYPDVCYVDIRFTYKYITNRVIEEYCFIKCKITVHKSFECMLNYRVIFMVNVGNKFSWYDR